MYFDTFLCKQKFKVLYKQIVSSNFQTNKEEEKRDTLPLWLNFVIQMV